MERATDRIPVLVYMHGNSSARVSLAPLACYGQNAHAMIFVLTNVFVNTIELAAGSNSAAKLSDIAGSGCFRF